MSDSYDDRALMGLIEESSDLHADSMREVPRQLTDFVAAAKESEFENSRSLGRGAVVAGVAGAAVLAGALPAMAAKSSGDIKSLQTAAAIENLAVITYTKALTLSFIGGSEANGVVKAFVTTTLAQHTDHAKAFNAAATKLGGAAQKNPDAKYLKVVEKALPTLTSAAPVVGLAIALEDVAAQTYIKSTGTVTTKELRQLFLSVAGVEAQHKAILLAVQALVKAGAPELIALPPMIAKYPAAAGKVGFPDAFYPTKLASPSSEGAVK